MIEYQKGQVYICSDYAIWIFKENHHALSLSGYYGNSSPVMMEINKKDLKKLMNYNVEAIKPNNNFLILETPIIIKDDNGSHDKFLLKVLTNEKIGWIKVHGYMDIQKLT